MGFLKSQKCIYEISTIFKRKPSAICSRIIKFEDESLNDLSKGLILLAPTNRRTYQVNHKKLNSIDSPEFSYLGKVTGSFKLSDMMSEKNLKLKVGAQVMLTKNDPNGRWVNGTIGFVDKLEKDKIFVKVGKKVFQVEIATWEKFDYDLKNGKYVPRVIGKFEQYPIKLAWAATIHKCQGQTFEKAVIDFDTGSFAHGMTYVALSRVKSIGGLHLIRPIKLSDVRFDNRIYKFQDTVELFH
jgi:ATP-dependent exoDNAse (exonuclease V) alpha subunit